MTDTKEKVDEFFERHASALLARDEKTIAQMYAVPSLILFPGNSIVVNDAKQIESAVKQAQDAAGDKDVRISGGANAIQQYLRAGLVDECTIHYSPVFLGGGIPLFVDISPDTKVVIRETVPAKDVTHVTYKELIT